MTKLLKLGTTILATFALVACGESGGSGQGNESLEINQEQAEAKMEQLAETDGFYLKFQYTSQSDDEAAESHTMYYGYKGNIFWLGDGDSYDVAVKMGDTQYDYYSKEDGAWTYQSSMSKAQAEEYGLEKGYKTLATSWFYWGNTYDGQLKKGKDTTIAGRKCYTYTYDYSANAELQAYAALLGGDASVSIKYEIAVDKELGITMKVAVSGSSSEGSGSFNYEVIEFKTGNALDVPNLPAAQPANND